MALPPNLTASGGTEPACLRLDHLQGWQVRLLLLLADAVLKAG